MVLSPLPTKKWKKNLLGSNIQPFVRVARFSLVTERCCTGLRTSGGSGTTEDPKAPPFVAKFSLLLLVRVHPDNTTIMGIKVSLLLVKKATVEACG